MTTDGDFVHDLDSVHKKPYETIVIGRSPSYEEGELGCARDSGPSCSTPTTEYGTGAPCHGAGATGKRQQPHFSLHHVVEPSPSQLMREEGSSSDEPTGPSGPGYDGCPPAKQPRLASSTTARSYDDCGCQCQSVPVSQGSGSCSRRLPQRYMFMCVPSTVHSQKPYLGGGYGDMGTHKVHFYTLSSSSTRDRSLSPFGY